MVSVAVVYDFIAASSRSYAAIEALRSVWRTYICGRVVDARETMEKEPISLADVLEWADGAIPAIEWDILELMFCVIPIYARAAPRTTTLLPWCVTH